jgi:hypothetical protein
MMKRNLMFAVAFAAAILASSSRTLLSAEQSDQALIKAIGGAKISLLQGIAQVAKTEVPTDAKYELEDGKLMLSIYTSAKGLDTAAEDNSFNEYGGDATVQPTGLRTRRCSPISSTLPGRRSITRCCQ